MTAGSPRARLLAAALSTTFVVMACCGSDDFLGIGGFPPPPPPAGSSSSSVVYLADQDTDGVNELYHLRIESGALPDPSASTGPGLGMSAGGPTIPGTIEKLHPDLAPGGGVGPVQLDHDGGRVVFRLWEQDPAQAELFAVDVSGPEPGEPQRLDTDASGIPGGVAQFALASDGSRLLYRRAGGGQSGLFLVDLDGASLDPQRVDDFTGVGGGVGGGAGAPAAQVLAFSFSPDASQVAFLRDDGVEVELYVRPVADVLPTAGLPDPQGASGGPILVSASPPPGGAVLDFVFSPLSTRIAWRQRASGVDVLQVADVLANGVGAPLLASGGDAAGLDVFPKYEFAADGALLAFMADDPDGPAGVPGGNANPQALFLTSPDGAGYAPAARVSPSVDPGGTVYRFLHAPDGSGIAYVADQDLAGQVELYWIGLDLAVPSAPVKLNDPLPQGGDVDIADGGGDVHKRVLFAPDSSGIVYAADQAEDELWELFFVRLDGPAPAAPVRLNGPLPPGGDVVGPYHFSGDGALLVYRADQDVDDELELFLVDMTDPDPASTVVQLSGDMVPGGDAADQVHFSPDRTTLIYRADQEQDEVYEIFLVDLEELPLHEPLKVNGLLAPGGDVSNFFQLAP